MPDSRIESIHTARATGRTAFLAGSTDPYRIRYSMLIERALFVPSAVLPNEDARANWPGAAPRHRPRAANDERIPAPSTRKLDVDRRLLELAMARHAEVDDNDTVAVWLDLETGAVLWLYAHDEDEAGPCADDAEPCRRMHELVRWNPSRYVVVPAHTRDAHRSLLTAFLKTRWTEHSPERLAALERYRGSLGAWIADTRNRHALQAFRVFRAWHFTELATTLLREHGIEAS